MQGFLLKGTSCEKSQRNYKNDEREEFFGAAVGFAKMDPKKSSLSLVLQFPLLYHIGLTIQLGWPPRVPLLFCPLLSPVLPLCQIVLRF